MATIAETVKDLVLERSRMLAQVRKLDKAIFVLRKLGTGSRLLNSIRSSGRKRRTLSAAARRRISAAQKARWAKVREKPKKAA